MVTRDRVEAGGARIRARGGFTLIEVIVSIVIGAVLMGTLYDMFYSGAKINKDTQTKADALMAASFTIASVQADLKQLVTLPVERKSSGENALRYGDHFAPVKISPLGRNITFYVPDPKTKRGSLPTPGAVAISYTLSPSPEGGLFVVKRTENSPDNEEEAKGHILTGVTVRDMKFRLLDPKSPQPADKSPDQNYYVETVVTGTDSTGRETMTMTALTELENPSIYQHTHNRYVNETVAFKPEAPLPPVPDSRSATKPQLDALTKTRDLADKFEKGQVTVKELEDQVREVIAIADGLPPGRKDLVATNGPTTPLGKTPLSLAQHGPGRPIEFTTPNGDHILVPTNHGDTINRLTDGFNAGPNGGAQGGAGNIRIVMTDMLETFNPDGSGGLAVTGQTGRRRTGEIGFSSDAGTNFQAVHDAAMNSLQTPVDNFVRGFGIPPLQNP